MGFSCKAILSFYVREAENTWAWLQDYFRQRERFDGIQKEYKKKSKPSNQEIDDYNKAVNEVNKAGQNTTIQSTRLTRKELNCSKPGINLLMISREHTPKYR